MKTRVKTIAPTIGQYLLDALHANGVEHIFGLPGDYIIRFDKMIEEHQIRFINTTRENTAGYMADAYGRLRGLGVACVTYGVGINITNAISQAFVECSPVVVISGAAGTEEYLRCQKLHHLFNKAATDSLETTQLDIFKNITVDQAILNDPITAQRDIDRVIGSCLLHKKPVYIELPRDHVATPINHVEDLLNPHPRTDLAPLKEALQEVEEMLSRAKRPVIWVGHETQRYGRAENLLAFAERYRIPIATSLLGKSAVSERHPLFIGVYQGALSRPEVAEYVESSDCIFALGVQNNEVDTGMFTARLEEVPQVVATTERVQIKHHRYAGVFFSDFIDSLSDLELNIRYRNDYPANIDRSLPSFIPKKGKKTTTARVFECIQHYLEPEHLIISDIGDCLFGSSDLVVEQDCYISNAYFASLGFAIPGALGAKFALPKKRVVAIMGDGAFQMNCMELTTAVRYGLDPIVILLNNHGYGTERPIKEGKFNEIVNWSYADIPRILNGGKGMRVTTEDQLQKAFEKALAAEGEFFIIEVELKKDDYSPAMQRFNAVAREG